MLLYHYLTVRTKGNEVSLADVGRHLKVGVRQKHLLSNKKSW